MLFAAYGCQRDRSCKRGWLRRKIPRRIRVHHVPLLHIGFCVSWFLFRNYFHPLGQVAGPYRLQDSASTLTPSFQTPQALGLLNRLRNVLACGMSKDKQAERGARKSPHALPDESRPVHLYRHAHATGLFARPPQFRGGNATKNEGTRERARPRSKASGCRNRTSSAPTRDERADNMPGRRAGAAPIKSIGVQKSHKQRPYEYDEAGESRSEAVSNRK